MKTSTRIILTAAFFGLIAGAMMPVGSKNLPAETDSVTLVRPDTVSPAVALPDSLQR